MVASLDEINDFMKHSMSTEDPYQAEIPDMMKEIDAKYKRQQEEENEVKQAFEKGQERAQLKEAENPSEDMEQQQDGQQGIIPPIGIAKPELVEAVLNNMNDKKKILEAIDEAEKYERETPQDTNKREVLGHGARFAENLFGSIGNVIRMVLPDLEGDEPEEITKTGYKPGEFDLRKSFPTTEELREFTKSKTGKYLEPKNKTSKASQELIGDIGAGAPYIPLTGPLAALGIPLIGQVAKEGVKWSGGSESDGDLAKAGIMTVASIANIGNARGVATQAVNAANNMIPDALRVSSGPTLRAFNRLRNQAWYRTGTTPEKAPAFDMMERIERMIDNNGTINLRDAMQLRRDLNKARTRLGAFSIPPIVDKAGARRLLNMVDDALMESMEHYGQNVNPNWLRSYEQANQAFAVTERTGKLSELIEKYAKPLQSDMAKVLFHTGGAAATTAGLGGAIGAVGSVLGAGALAGQTYKIMNRMIRSPLIRRHYIEVLTAAGTGNSEVINKALKRFDQVALKYEYPKDKDHNH